MVLVVNTSQAALAESCDYGCMFVVDRVNEKYTPIYKYKCTVQGVGSRGHNFDSTLYTTCAIPYVSEKNKN